jgi:ribosomal protein S6--L-glutamate ligase
VKPPAIALETRLRHCHNVHTLGVRPNFGDYSAEEQDLIRRTDRIYYPSVFYADLLDAMGKTLFPSYHTYKCVQDKIKQSALFALLQIPHPRTRVYYGKAQQARIAQDFSFPLIAKVPRGSALGRGVFRIDDAAQLAQYCAQHFAAYIQDYLPIDRDIRVVVIGDKVVHAYWRIAAPGDFRTNVAAGGRVALADVPPEALALAQHTARLCRWNDVGLDICCFEGRYLVLEGNMKYGKAGFRAAGIDYHRLMEGLIADGEI